MAYPNIDEYMSDVRGFLNCQTPDEWVDAALPNLPTLLIDHANCEKKAASTAISLMFKYIDRKDLLSKMSKLAREELVHFDQVVKILYDRNIEYIHVSAGNYVAGLIKEVRNHEPYLLIDKLIVGAIVEARSCERFGKLIPVFDEELAKFYYSLLKSECRHYQDYLNLANSYSDEPVENRVKEFLDLEESLIMSSDEQFRFHSGIPI